MECGDQCQATIDQYISDNYLSTLEPVSDIYYFAANYCSVYSYDYEATDFENNYGFYVCLIGVSGAC